jgi:hypothetical protein
MQKQEPKPTKQSKSSLAEEILNRGDTTETRALFAFDRSNTEDEILVKFNLWSRWYFPQYFKAPDAPFHNEIDSNNLGVYRGRLKFFVDIVFRGGAKTTRTKLFMAFAISNDLDHSRKYFKVLTEDGSNSKQIVTDVYNMLISPRVHYHYPEVFEKTVEKREETMSSFTTATGVKVRAGTVGTDQRGQIQEDARPDFIFFDDFETRKTLRSAVETKSIWDNMEEARTGLSKDGGAVYTCNYLSERGNVHRLVQKDSKTSPVLIVPIKFEGKPMWDAYTIEEIDKIEADADDFAGEYLCEPSAGLDILFDRSSLERQVKKTPIREIAGFRIFHNYDASHRYGSGHDVAGGVGLDSSTSVFIDFSTIPARVVATFKSNTIKPDTFGDEIKSEADRFGAPIVAVENNKFDMCIGRLKQIYDNLYFTEQKETRVGLPPRTRTYGWNTNPMTKPKMLFDFKKAVEDGLLELSDADLIAEVRSYTRDDLMDKEEDARLTTRHFDLLIAGAIAWQMKDYAQVKKEDGTSYQQPKYESPLISHVE